MTMSTTVAKHSDNAPAISSDTSALAPSSHIKEQSASPLHSSLATQRSSSNDPSALPSTPPRRAGSADPHSPPSRFGTPSGSISMRGRTGRLPSPIQPAVRPHSHNGNHPYIRPALNNNSHPTHDHPHGSQPLIRRANLSGDVTTPITTQQRLEHWRETQQMIAAHVPIDQLPLHTDDGIVFAPKSGKPLSPHPWARRERDEHDVRREAEQSRSIQQMISSYRTNGKPLGALSSPFSPQGATPTAANHRSQHINMASRIPPPPSVTSTGGLPTPLDSAQQRTARPGAHQVLAEQQRQRQTEATNDVPLTAPLTSGGAGLLTPLKKMNQKGSEMLRQQLAQPGSSSIAAGIEPSAPLSAPLNGIRSNSRQASGRGIDPPLRSAGLPSVLRVAGTPPPNHAIAPTVGLDGTIITIDMKTMSIPTPDPPVQLEEVPKRVREAWAGAEREGVPHGLSHREFAMAKLVEWGPEYYYAPHTADLWILFPYSPKRRPADSTPSSAHVSAAGRPKLDGIWTKPLLGGQGPTNSEKFSVPEPVAEAEKKEEGAYKLNILSYKRLIKVNRDADPFTQPSFDYYAVPVHMNYVTPFSLLFSRILHAATGTQVDQPIPRDSQGKVNWQSPIFSGAEMWTTPRDGMRMMYLPIPDPRSFLLLLHWMYFQRKGDIHRCLIRRVASWEGMVQNIEYLEMYAEARELVQSWWDRWVAPSDSSPRYQGGFSTRSRARARARHGIDGARPLKRGRWHSADDILGRSLSSERAEEDETNEKERGRGEQGDIAMDGSDVSDGGHEADDEGAGAGVDAHSVDRLADQVSLAFSGRD